MFRRPRSAQNKAASASFVAVKLEEESQATTGAQLLSSTVDEAGAATAAREEGAILAALSAGALKQDAAAASAREVAVKVEPGNEATEAKILPKPVLSLGDRVEIYWVGEGVHCAGAIVGIEGGMVDVLYDDGDVGSYDMEKEVWRLEGDGAQEEEDEEEERGEEKKEDDWGEMEKEKSTNRSKKQASGRLIRCGVGECVYKCKLNGNLKRHKAHIHGIDVQWFDCHQCGFKCKQNDHLKVHKAHIHDGDVKWFKGDKCDYKSKENGTREQHKAKIHDIDVNVVQV